MTTFKGFMRSTNASLNRLERAHNRRVREAAKEFKLQQKQQELENATKAVQDYDEYVSVLKSVHKDVGDTIDWAQINGEPKPQEPQLTHEKENEAKKKLEHYRPSFIDKLFALSNGKIKRLQQKITLAVQEDQQHYKASLQKHQGDLKEWEELQIMSKGIMAKDVVCYRQAIEYFNPFSDIKELGSKLELGFEKEYVLVDLYINGDDIVPKYVLSQTTTGKLSKKNMPVTKFNELYQDYVCSCILRVGRETLSCLPIKYVIVTALGNLLNTTTGKMEDRAVLSVAFYPETLERINFESIDPSDSMKNFVHNMKFSKTNGFSPVNKVQATNLLS